MKPIRLIASPIIRSSRLVLVAAVVTTTAGFLASSAHAGSAVWDGGNGLWSVGTNWTPDVSPGGTAGDSATFTAGASSTITQDAGAGLIMGTLTLGGNANSIWTISTSSFTMNQDGAGAGSATISNTNTSTGTSNRFVIGSSLTLADNLNVTNSGGSNAAKVDGSINLSGAISGTGNITINNVRSGNSGVGAIRMTGGNSFVGNTNIESGSLVFVVGGTAAATGTFGTNANNTVNLGITNGTSVAIITDAGGTTLGRKISVAALAANQTASLVSTSTNNLIVTNTVALNGSLNVITGANNGTASIRLDGAISGVGGLTITNNLANANGTVRLMNGGNTFTGETQLVRNGTGGTTTLQLANAVAIQNSTLNLTGTGTDTRVIFGQSDGGTNVGPQLTSATFGGLKGGSNLSLQNTLAGPGAVALSVGQNNSSNEFSGVISGLGSLTKTGTGTQTLSAATGNTYAGGTTVSAGKLRLANTTGSATGTGAVAVSGANVTTSGTGLSTGLLTATNGARIAPGTNVSDADGSGRNNFGSAQTLSLGLTGGMTLTSATFDFDLSSIATSGNDLIATGSDLSLGNSMAFNFNELNGSLQTGAAYTLISGANMINSFDSTNWTTNFFNGSAYIANYAAQGNNLTVMFTAVPEPTAAVMLGLGLSLLTLRRRRA